MKQFEPRFTDIEYYRQNDRQPNFTNLLKVLDRQKPDRPTLFEFFLNDDLYLRLAGKEKINWSDPIERGRLLIDAFRAAGYDYATVSGSDFSFESHRRTDKTVSLNDGALIIDRESFRYYSWPDPGKYDYSRLDALAEYLPRGMKLIVSGPGGVLENVISLTGFDNLCFMLADDPVLAGDIFGAIGSRLLQYYELSAPHSAVGALISNDDWGFNTQTMLSERDMRKYVLPWHKKIVGAIHVSGKPAILHSCGNLSRVMNDIIDDLKYDGKHSYEDKIMPVEKAYEQYGGRIAVLGGIDLDFVCRSMQQDVYNRSAKMLEKAQRQGGYALGTGNSVPYYVPDKNYLAMIAAARILN